MKFQSLLFTMLVAVLSFGQVPTITSFSPASGPVGTTVTITGTNFSTTAANNTVFVGSAKATVTSATGTQLVVTLPNCASSNTKIQVVSSGKSALSNRDFVYTYSGGVSGSGSIYDHFDNNVVTSAVGPDNSEFSSWPGYGSRIGAGDFDNDGDMDFLALGNAGLTTAKIFRNTNPSGNFTSSNFSSSDINLNQPNNTSLSVSPADLDNDGMLDLVVSGTNGGILIFRNTSNSSAISFTQTNITTTNTNHARIKFLDVDGDGFLDVVSIGQQAQLAIVKLTWSGSTVTGTLSTVGLSSMARGLCFSDVNLDGKMDFIYQLRPSTFTIGYILNNSTSGTVSLGSPTDLETGISQGSYSSVAGDLTSADYDGDGDFDIVYATSEGATQLIRIKEQTGSLTYGASIGIGNMSSGIPSGLKSVDLNGDGKIDILISGGSNSAPIKGILNNYSSGSLGSSSFGNVTYISFGMWGAGVEDFNNDGLIDIIHNDYYNSNLTFIPNTLPTPPAVSISVHPSTSTQTICSGTSGSALSITAANATSYQWQVSFNSGAYSNISGATTNSYTPAPTTAGTYTYKCIASNSGSTVTSNASGVLTVNNLPTLTTNPNTTLSQYCYSNPNTANGIVVATSASSPTYQWQQSTTAGGTFTNVSTGTGGTSATFYPSHVDVWYGGTKYYRCVVTSNGCSTTSNTKPYGVYESLTQVTIPSTANENYCINSTPNNLTMVYSGDNNLQYQWYWTTDLATWPGTLISGATSTTYTPPTNAPTSRYYRCRVVGTCSNTAKNSGLITVTDTYTWTGATSTDPTVASNWSPAAVPCSGANEVIPTGLTNYPAYANLTIASGTTLTVQSGGRLTVTGTLTNDGTLTIESGATFLQGTSLAGTGTYNVKQTVTGAGGATPTGRFWYMGLPINNLTRAAAFGAASGSNRLWSWSESGQVWSSQITDATTLTPTTGYVFRTGATSTTLNFSGTSLYSANASITGLTNSGGTFDGCHLMSNPYTAYLDWEAIVADAGTTNLASTYCVRSFNSTSSEMVYDTYNATGDVAVNPSGVAMTRYIAPMQSFWITVNPSTTGTLSMTKAMLTHQAGAVGLKDITSFPAFARLNLVSGNFYDQVVVYTDANANAELENYDSKKFFLPNKAQVYCQVGNEKLVINALKQGKAQTSAPLTVELPSTQVYKFEMAESFVENGLVILEDKQEGIFQDMGVNPVYEFFGNSGVIADRFVLHFQLPNGTNNEGQAGIEDLTSGQIAVIANHNGAVTVALSADLTTSGDIQIFDEAGRLVAQKAITSAQTSLQLNNGMGVYFVRVQTPMKTEMKKVMVY